MRRSVWVNGLYVGSADSPSIKDMRLVCDPRFLPPLPFVAEIHYMPSLEGVMSRKAKLTMRRYDPTRRYTKATLLSERVFDVDRVETRRLNFLGLREIAICVGGRDEKSVAARDRQAGAVFKYDGQIMLERGSVVYTLLPCLTEAICSCDVQ